MVPTVIRFGHGAGCKGVSGCGTMETRYDMPAGMRPSSYPFTFQTLCDSIPDPRETA